MTRDELRAGLRRLAVLAAVLVVVAAIVSGGFMAFGATTRSGVSAGAGVVGLLLVLCGIAAFGRTQPIKRGPGGFEVVERAERREAEALTGGLLGLGVAFCAVSLGIG
jgi:hypothetical protein